RQTDFENEVTGVRTHFFARNPSFEIAGIPAFWLPAAAGTVVQKSPLRHAEISHARGFGLGVATEWGVFESLGLLAPKSLDMSYHLDYYSKRGPGVGVDAQYKGGFITETTLQPWTYEGDFISYLALDHGKDDFGKRRVDVDPEQDVRGRFYWQHQSFLPNDWQVQFTAGYISDRNFMEEWFNRDFRLSQPLQTSLYAKRQQDNEAYTFLVAVQPNNFATVFDLYQEQFEIERLPEISYHRIGDSFWQDRVTFFSNNSIGGVRFDPSSATLQDLGFAPQPVGFQSPGIPSLGQTGTPNDVTWRADFQQELNWPFSAGTLRVVPYVIGRYTYYSQTPEGADVERVSSSAGLRITTAFWKVDDTVHSDLFDLQRLRHVIEPVVNFYAGAQSQDRADIYIYDEPIDAVSGITVAQVAINQRWQTKRGGPGRWRSVDVFTLNTEANFFINQPPESELDPENFRGLFFMSMPEASIPRDSINIDAQWQISDAVTLSGGTEYNMTKGEWATANAMLQVNHSPRLRYNFGWRHIGLDFEEVIRRHPWIPASEDPDNGNTLLVEQQDLILFGAEYELSAKYRLQLANSYDVAQHRNDRSIISLVRHFDRFYMSIGLRVDDYQGENSILFNVWPEGMEPGKGSQAVRGSFSN
ncbi:MAG TPA: LPS assembly protein LptD, partial [Tepidisphaeraceae bacterium]|nr:LPS assembly protein LptD [Tepidisphaeraceae bacterium]